MARIDPVNIAVPNFGTGDLGACWLCGRARLPGVICFCDRLPRPLPMPPCRFQTLPASSVFSAGTGKPRIRVKAPSRPCEPPA